MLKPVDPAPEPSSERPVGELVQQLIEEGKACARAEINLVKAIAGEKAKALIVAAALLATALLFALAGITAFALGVVLALAQFIGPLGAGFVGLLVFAAIAGGLGWYGIERARRSL